MKTTITAAACLALFTVPALAQERTLIDGPVESGGFGGPVIKFSEVRNQFAVLVGGRGGWILNHTFVIGAAGYGLASDIRLDSRFPGRDVEFGYGGLDLEYIYDSNSLVHFSAQALIGGGAIDLVFGGESDVVFVFEPQGNVELNMTRYFRISVGGGYRFVSDVDFAARGNADFSAPYFALTLKFGKF